MSSSSPFSLARGARRARRYVGAVHRDVLRRVGVARARAGAAVDAGDASDINIGTLSRHAVTFARASHIATHRRGARGARGDGDGARGDGGA